MRALSWGAHMKSTPGSTPAERELYWTQVIHAARKYSGGVAAYCTQKDVSKDNYYYWFHRLRAAHPEWYDLAKNRRKGQKSKRSSYQKQQPETEVVEKPRRRKFTALDRARILQETDAAPPGQVAAILRREGVYASQLQKWRTERDVAALAPKKRGPKSNPLTAQVKNLQAQNARLEKRLHQANQIIELQKKVSEILGVTLEQIDEED